MWTLTAQGMKPNENKPFRALIHRAMSLQTAAGSLSLSDNLCHRDRDRYPDPNFSDPDQYFFKNDKCGY